jgi:hypothetical protein
MQSFVIVVSGTTTSDKVKPTRAGIGLNLAAGINCDFILGAQNRI